MTRPRLLGLLAVLALLAGAVAYGTRGGDGGSSGGNLPALRREAALQPCPAGLSPQLPDLELSCLGGGPRVKISSAATGTPTLINVYGSWCPPCQEEMPVLAAFARSATGKVALVGVDSQDTPSQALPFFRDFGAHWPAVVDDDGVLLRRFGGPPSTLFVTPEGRIAYVKTGKFASLAELRQLVATHLGVRV